MGRKISALLFGAEFAVAFGCGGTGADFSFASSDFKALGAFFCNFPFGSCFPQAFARNLRNFNWLHRNPNPTPFCNFPAACQPESRTVSRAPLYHILWVRRLSSPYHFRARIQSFQAVAAPFPGDSVSLSRRDPGDRNASAQKIDDRLDGLLRAAAQERLGSHPQIASFQTVVLHAGLETPRPPGEDRGRPKSYKKHHSCLLVFPKINRCKKIDAAITGEIAVSYS